MSLPEAEIDWRDQVLPVSRRFEDPYYSLEDGLAETRHVFLAGNGLPARFRDGFAIAELGFGTGLNFLATWMAWIEHGLPGSFAFTSFEAFPMGKDDIARALSAFPEVSKQAEEMLDHWSCVLSGEPLYLGPARLWLVPGDARQTLPGWPGRADAWYLDGFSPARNPELWEPALMSHVADHSAPGATAATYTAAGFVRRGLAEAGFDVTRVAGYGRKRHMTLAKLTR